MQNLTDEDRLATDSANRFSKLQQRLYLGKKSDPPVAPKPYRTAEQKSRRRLRKGGHKRRNNTKIKGGRLPLLGKAHEASKLRFVEIDRDRAKHPINWRESQWNQKNNRFTGTVSLHSLDDPRLLAVLKRGCGREGPTVVGRIQSRNQLRERVTGTRHRNGQRKRPRNLAALKL